MLLTFELERIISRKRSSVFGIPNLSVVVLPDTHIPDNTRIYESGAPPRRFVLTMSAM